LRKREKTLILSKTNNRRIRVTGNGEKTEGI